MSDTVQIVENTAAPKPKKPYASERKSNAWKALGWYVVMLALVIFTAYNIVRASGADVDESVSMDLYGLAALTAVPMFLSGMCFMMYLEIYMGFRRRAKEEQQQQ